MKKNKTLRTAGIALAVVALTTCAIAGTFAKYVTSDGSSDSARVAKFGVVLAASDNSSFKTEYKTDDTAYKGELSVKSYNGTDKVVAPGTSDAGITFSISGTPEVATKVDISMSVTNDVFLKKANGLNDYTQGKVNEKWQTFDLTNDYYPVVFTLKQGDTTVATGKLTDIETAIEQYASTAYYAPNTKLDATFTLSWAWAFNGNDKADTWLGNAAANAATYAQGTKGTDYDTDIAYDVTFTVTQVD